LLPEKALATASGGNDTNTLENATAALTEATSALLEAVQHLAPNNTEGMSDNSTLLSIEASREKYALGEPIQFFGNLTITNGTMANTPIRVTISPTSAESQCVINTATLNLVNRTFSSSESGCTVGMTLAVINGTYAYRGLIPFKEAGVYQVKATTTDNNTALAFIELVDLFHTPSTGCVIATLVFFAILIITIYRYGQKRTSSDYKSGQKDFPIAQDPFNDEHLHRAEVSRFIALTGISVSLILSLIFLEVEVNPNGPLGLVNINSNGELNNNTAFTEWAINIGGSSNDNYESGLIIPVYVITLGLIGGFMRYLHKALAKTEVDLANLPREKEKLKEDEGTASGFVHFSLGELSDILIAPILALAVWFILHQEIQSVFMLAAISLTVGLATPNIVSGLKRFASSSAPAGRSESAPAGTSDSAPAGVG
jgi:hypothetical protein